MLCELLRLLLGMAVLLHRVPQEVFLLALLLWQSLVQQCTLQLR
jgi:hypothetical protein